MAQKTSILPEDTPVLLKKRQLAEILQVHPDWVEQRCRREPHLIPPTFIGEKLVRYHRDDVEAYLARNRTAPEDDDGVVWDDA